MKKYLLAAASLVALAAPAAAADMAARPMYTKAPPMVAAVYNWTGFYVGINGGAGFGSKCWDFAGTVAGGPVNPLPPMGCHSPTGGTVGGQIGYNWQAGAWVFGVEAQGNWANLSGSNISQFNPAWTDRSRVDAYGLFTARVGYAFNNVLLYVKGGAAVAADRYDTWVTLAPATNGTASETRWGGAVGAGLEFGFAPNWTAGVEYNHLFLGSRNITFTNGDIYRIRQDLDTVTAKVNYKF